MDTRHRSCTLMLCFSISRKRKRRSTGPATARTLPISAVRNCDLSLRAGAASKGQGYEIERGKSGQPEIVGYTREYLDASSPRSQQIQAYLEQQGVKGAGAAQIAAHQTRDDKLPSITHCGNAEDA